MTILLTILLIAIRKDSAYCVDSEPTRHYLVVSAILSVWGLPTHGRHYELLPGSGLQSGTANEDVLLVVCNAPNYVGFSLDGSSICFSSFRFSCLSIYFVLLCSVAIFSSSESMPRSDTILVPQR